MFKPIPKQTREEILGKIKNEGKSVSELAIQYVVSSKTILCMVIPIVNEFANLIPR